MITIIDYGSGNIKSIKNGFSKIGVHTKISRDTNELKSSDALVLPGVGAFGYTMKNLHNYAEIIHQHIENDKPFLGICMGLQALFSKSQESEGVEGLNIFEGDVIKFPVFLKNNCMKIPHMGWNNLKIKFNCPILNNIGSEYMYFVHSYYVKPSDDAIIAASVDYGVEVPAVICKDQVFATQFHPEKSGSIGLRILKNFVKLV